MKEKKIWLSSPHMCGNEIEYVKKSFDEDWIAPLGPSVDGFERDLELFLGNESKVAVLNSGTAALHLALIILGVQQGDYVLCQSLTFSASANVINYLGAIPVFIDSEPETWNLCPETLETAIVDLMQKGTKPKAIIAVSLYGMPYKIDEITEISKKYNIPVVEDSAESLGSSYKGRKLGTFGDISVISFNGNKIITTSGGGALISKDENIKNKAIFLATQAKEDQPHYEHKEIGYNYRLSNISAAIGRGQMEVLPDRILQRRENNFFYRELFNDINGIEVLKEPNSDFYSNHWLTVIVVDEKIAGFNKEDLRLALMEADIESRPVWKPMHLQPVFRDELYFGNNIAENIFNNGLCLPSGSNLTKEDKGRIFTSIINILKAHSK